jgi:hypothetical protein
MKLPIAVLLSATLLIACSESMCGCPPAVYQIRFSGSVISSSTGPITDAHITATFTGEDCRFGEPVSNNPNEGAVNSGGHYEFMALLGHAGAYCARLTARWPSDSATRDSIPVVAPSTVVVDFNVP